MVFQAIGNWVEDAVETVSDAADAATEAILKIFTGPIDDVTKVIEDLNNIICFIEKFPVRIRNVKSGIEDITHGIELQIKATGEATVLGFENIAELGDVIGLLISSYGSCIMQFVLNLVWCIWFYLFDVFLHTIYLIVYFCVWVICGILVVFPFGIDNPVSEIFESLFNNINKLDESIFIESGIHFAHYPSWVRENCYMCKTLKPEVVISNAKKVDEVFSKDIPKLFGVGNDSINRGASKFDEAVTKAFPEEPKYIK
jgi:hypothetical protein